MSEEKILYVIRSLAIEWRLLKSIDYIMDNNENIICWRDKNNAIEFLKRYDLDSLKCVCQTTIEELSDEIETKRPYTNHIHIRVIDTIEFD